MAKDATYNAGDLGAAIVAALQAGLAVALKPGPDGLIRISAIEMPTEQDRADADLEAWLSNGRD